MGHRRRSVRRSLVERRTFVAALVLAAGTVAGLAGCSTTEPAHPSASSVPSAPSVPAASRPPPAPAPARIARPALLSPAEIDDVAPKAPVVSYDLAADIRARREEGERDLGRGARSAVVGEIFVLVGAPGDGGRFAASRRLTERALTALHNERLDRQPSQAVTVLLFWNAATYDKYCRDHLQEACMSPYGFFQPDRRRIIMNAGPGLGTLTHELVHPLVRADFPDAPTWLDEGLASLFEAPVIPRDGEIHGAKNWRLPRLLKALGSAKEKQTATLPSLLRLSDDDFRDDDESLHYAMARYFCQWLDSRGLLWDFYRAYRGGFHDDARGERAFARVLGTTPDRANTTWVRWVQALAR